MRVHEFGFDIGEGYTPGEVLERKIQNLLKDPPKVDSSGKPISGDLTYSEAFKIVMRENPELTQEYSESLY